MLVSTFLSHLNNILTAQIFDCTVTRLAFRSGLGQYEGVVTLPHSDIPRRVMGEMLEKLYDARILEDEPLP